MKASTISSIKKELVTLPPGDMVELCLKLAKYKKENKELLSYLLFEANSEKNYIENVKKEIDPLFSEINQTHLYFAKKSIRKILKIINKYIRFSGHKQTEVELLIYFCTQLKQSGIRFQSINALSNLYTNQIRKISTAISALHEDLQYDYNQEVTALTKR